MQQAVRSTQNVSQLIKLDCKGIKTDAYVQKLTHFHRRSQGGAEGAITPPKMSKKYIFNEKVDAPNFYFSAQKPAREAYNDHSWVRSAPPQEECPLQDKFLAMPMLILLFKKLT